MDLLLPITSQSADFSRHYGCHVTFRKWVGWLPRRRSTTTVRFTMTIPAYYISRFFTPSFIIRQHEQTELRGIR
jgi:hypothetical protein